MSDVARPGDGACIEEEELSLLLDDELAPEQADRARAHVADCPNCNERWEELDYFRSVLSHLPGSTPSAEFEARFFDRVRSELAPDGASSAPPPSRSTSPPATMSIGGGGMLRPLLAAIVAAALTWTVATWHRPPTPTPTETNGAPAIDGPPMTAVEPLDAETGGDAAPPPPAAAPEHVTRALARACAVLDAATLERLPADAELHVVAVHEGAGARPAPGFHPTGRVTVRIDRRAAPIVLVLVSSEPVAWTITTAPGTRLVAVIAAGEHAPRVEGVDAAIVELRDDLAPAPTIDPSDDALDPAAALARSTGRAVASFRTAYVGRIFRITGPH